ncbi:LON peptidase N-terminal domain and RING finger protein 3, partial [Perkinsus olseni]
MIDSPVNGTGDNNKSKDDDRTMTTFECPICLRLLVHPVTTACGHTFCKYCITKTMDHRQLCPSCRAPCPFIGSTNVMVANLIQQRHALIDVVVHPVNRFPEEYALRSKEVKELEEEEKANAQSNDADGSAQGVFFPFIRLPHGSVLFPYGNRQSFIVTDEEADAARAVWRGGAARSVVAQIDGGGGDDEPSILGEISQIRGERIWFVGRGRVEGLGLETYTNTSGFKVRKYSTTAVRDDAGSNQQEEEEEQEERDDIVGVAEACLAILYDERLPMTGEMGINKFNQLHDNRSRPTRRQLEAMGPLEFEKLSFWLCSCLRAPL